VVPIVEKMRENRSRRFSQVTREGDSEAVRVAMEINVEGKSGRGRETKEEMDR